MSVHTVSISSEETAAACASALNSTRLPGEESQQEKSLREFAENYDRVVNATDLSDVSTKDLVRAVSWASRYVQHEKRKGWDGGTFNKAMVQAVEVELGCLRSEETRRRVSFVADYQQGGDNNNFLRERAR